MPWSRRTTRSGEPPVAPLVLTARTYGHDVLDRRPRIDDARAEVAGLLADEPGWEVILRGFAAKGMIAAPPGMSIEDLIRQAGPLALTRPCYWSLRKC